MKLLPAFLLLLLPFTFQAQPLSSLTGRYQLPSGTIIQFTLQNKNLVLVVPGAPLQALKRINKTKFQSTAFPDQYFTFSQTGQTTTVLSQTPGETLKGTRLDKNVKVWSTTMDSILIRTFATPHFTLRYTPADSTTADSIAAGFEKNYTRILADLKLTSIPTVTVRIYPDLPSFHKGINFPDAPNQVLATAFGKDDIRMVSPHNAGPEAWMLAYAAPHEFTHCVHLNIDYAPNNPRWLWESLAQYEAQWFFNPNDLDFIKKKEYPKLSDLNNGLEYMLGYTIIEAIHALWGQDAILQLIKHRGNPQNALNLNQQTFEQKIFTEIHKKYIKE